MVNKEQRASAPVEEIKTKSNIKNVQFIFMPTHPANHLASSIHIHIYCRQEEKSKLPSEKCQWELFLPPKHFSIVGLSLILFKHIPSGIQPQTVSWRSHNAWIPGRLQPLMSQQWRWYRLKVSPGCVFSIPGKDRSLLNKSVSQSVNISVKMAFELHMYRLIDKRTTSTAEDTALRNPLRSCGLYSIYSLMGYPKMRTQTVATHLECERKTCWRRHAHHVSSRLTATHMRRLDVKYIHVCRCMHKGTTLLHAITCRRVYMSEYMYYMRESVYNTLGKIQVKKNNQTIVVPVFGKGNSFWIKVLENSRSFYIHILRYIFGNRIIINMYWI